MFNDQSNYNHDTEYAINQARESGKPQAKESMGEDAHPYIPPGYNEYVGGPTSAGRFKE